LSVADLKYKEGVEQSNQNRLDEAEVTLREAVRLDASKPEYLTSLARVLLANPRYERAGTLPVVRSLLDRAVQIAPDFQEAADLHAQVIKEMSG
jgi:cytochrome c-type biogenesis protein CcmH/NrfG